VAQSAEVRGLIVASPVLLLVGDPLMNTALRRERARATRHPGGGFIAVRGGSRGAPVAHAVLPQPDGDRPHGPEPLGGDRLRR
jgi:hypothetical protein